MLQDRAPARRWPNRQRFTLSSEGKQAEASYRSVIVASRAQEGRASFELAQQGWAEELKVEPEDGLYLAEIATVPVDLRQLAQAVESCGKTRTEVVRALERLVDAGLVNPT